MKILKINDMLKHDSTMQFNQDYYEDKKDGENKKEIAGLSLPSAIDINKFIKTEEDKHIVSITPMALYNYKISYHDYTLLSFLAKNASGKLFIIDAIYSSIYSGDEKIIEFAKKNISFYDEKEYVDNKSRELVNKMLKQTMPIYYSDLDIKFKDNNSFSMTAVVGDGIYENSTEFYFSAAIMNTIKFTEVYIKDCILNNHDIVLSNYHGFNNTETNIYKIKDVLDIINIAPLNKEKSAIAIMLKIVNESDDIAFLLFVSNYVNDDILKKINTTTNDITKLYADNSDYWLAEFFYSSIINDEEYIIYSSRNNENSHVTYMFDQNAINKIEELLKK